VYEDDQLLKSFNKPNYSDIIKNSIIDTEVMMLMQMNLVTILIRIQQKYLKLTQ